MILKVINLWLSLMKGPVQGLSPGLAIQSKRFFASEVGHFTLVEVKEGNKEG